MIHESAAHRDSEKIKRHHVKHVNNQTRHPPPQNQAADEQHHEVIRGSNGVGYDEVPAQIEQTMHQYVRHLTKFSRSLNTEFAEQSSEAYTNAGVSLNLAVKVCVSGLVPTMATTAV